MKQSGKDVTLYYSVENFREFRSMNIELFLILIFHILLVVHSSLLTDATSCLVEIKCVCSSIT